MSYIHTTVPLSDQISMFIVLKNDYFQLWVLYQSDTSIFHYGSDKGFKITNMNQTSPILHAGLLEIALSIPLFSFIVLYVKLKTETCI